MVWVRTERRGRALLDVAGLFFRLGCTAFGGPAAHIALVERECVQRRQWITRERFLEVLSVASLIPGPTSTELVMHVGREHAGWAGLLIAGAMFIVPSALMVGALAAGYVGGGDLTFVRGAIAAVQPVVVVVIAHAMIALGRSAVRSVATGVLAVAVVVLSFAGVPAVALLLAAGFIHALGATRVRTAATTPALVAVTAVGMGAAATAVPVKMSALFGYFASVGSVLFGSGYVLLPALHDDLVNRLRWISDAQLIDAIAAGQATPGPVFTTATFIGYLLGGTAGAAVATLGMFLPAFVFSAISAALLPRLRNWRAGQLFLQGVNAAAVALIGVVVVTLARQAFRGIVPITLALICGALIVKGINPTIVLVGAAAGGAVAALF